MSIKKTTRYVGRFLASILLKEILHHGRNLSVNEFRKESSEKGVQITPTNPHNKIAVGFNDYG